MKPNIIDIEASGFGSKSYPIEIGVVLSNGLKYCSLIKPDHNWSHWDKKAEQVHGLSQELLYLHGKPIQTVAWELNKFLDSKTVYTDGWEVDKPWLSRLYEQAGLTPGFSISSLEFILKEAQMNIWTETKKQVIQDFSLQRHRASSDALIIQETYFRTYQAMLSGNGLQNISCY